MSDSQKSTENKLTTLPFGLAFCIHETWKLENDFNLRKILGKDFKTWHEKMLTENGIDISMPYVPPGPQGHYELVNGPSGFIRQWVQDRKV